jgi:hypothetical protein
MKIVEKTTIEVDIDFNSKLKLLEKFTKNNGASYRYWWMDYIYSRLGTLWSSDGRVLVSVAIPKRLCCRFENNAYYLAMPNYAKTIFHHWDLRRVEYPESGKPFPIKTALGMFGNNYDARRAIVLNDPFNRPLSEMAYVISKQGVYVDLFYLEKLNCVVWDNLCVNGDTEPVCLVNDDRSACALLMPIRGNV